MIRMSASEHDSERRSAGLKQMQGIAGGLLLVMLLVFIASSLGVKAHPGLAYLRAFAEAAMVGACADWFAVVALFRHPLGLPIPHTAIIPRNQVKIGQSLGRFISNNFLAPEEIGERLARIDAAAWMAHRLQDPVAARDIATRLHSYLPRIAALLSDARVQGLSRDLIRAAIDRMAVAPLAARSLAALISRDVHQWVFDQALATGQVWLDGQHDSFRARVSNSSSAWMPTWIDHKLADAFLAEVDDALAAARDAGHPWRVQFTDELQRLVIRLGEDPQLQEQVERIKSEILNDALIEDFLRWLQGVVEARVQAETQSPDRLTHILEQAITAFGAWLASDAEAARAFNQGCRQLIQAVIVPNRWEIGGFFADVIASWDARTLVERLEAQVGPDLQFIRINGTLVGGLVGLLIYSLGQFLP